MRTTVLAFIGVLAAATGCDDDCQSDYEPPTSYEQTLDEWAGAVVDDGTRAGCEMVVEGNCSDGKHFLVINQIFHSEVRYFNEAGAMVATAYQGDVIIGNCSGAFYPSRRAVSCRNPQWSALCGESPELAPYLPYAD